MPVDEHVIENEPGRRTHNPPHQNGLRAIVLGAREGNIGGAIAEKLCLVGYIAYEDDCYRPMPMEPSREVDETFFHPDYQPPPTKELEDYDACVITLGVTHMEPFSEVTRADFRKVMYGSLELPLECARRYVRARGVCSCGHCGGRMHAVDSLCVCNRCGWNMPMKSPGPHSKIVFVGSYAHDHPFTHCTSYCAAKAGLNMAVRCLAWELMPEGFDVFIINPHHVYGTPMTEEVLKGMQNGVHNMSREEAVAYQHKDLRMGRLSTPEDIAEMVRYVLMERNARWLSGQPINMYGGVR